MKHFLSVSRSPSNSNSNKSTTQHKRREEAQSKRCSAPARRHRQRSIIISGRTETHTHTHSVFLLFLYFPSLTGLKETFSSYLKMVSTLSHQRNSLLCDVLLQEIKIFSTLNPIKRHLFLLPQEKFQNRRIWKYFLDVFISRLHLLSTSEASSQCTSH